MKNESRPLSRDWMLPIGSFQISRRRLPHWQQPGSLYFVTFRAAALELPPGARGIVLKASLGNHGVMMDLHRVVVMPDHAHLVLQPLPEIAGSYHPAVRPPVHSLARIAHAIRSFSAHEINRLLARKGTVWQQERFDRIIRDAQEYREKLRYMLNNPVKRGLVADPYEYPWSAFPPAPTE